MSAACSGFIHIYEKSCIPTHHRPWHTTSFLIVTSVKDNGSDVWCHIFIKQGKHNYKFDATNNVSINIQIFYIDFG